MLHDIEVLLKLQDRDQSVNRIKALLERVPLEEAKAHSRLSDDVAAVAEAKHALQENEIAIKNVELDVQTREDQIAKFKLQQLQTRKNEEYQALGHEITRFTNDISGLETKELEFMESGDAIKARLAAATEALARTQALVNEELASLEERRKVGESQLANFEEERAEIAAGIDEDALDLYERLLKSKGDVAVVPLEGDRCTGCHMTITKSTQLHVKAQKEIVHCDQCSRMLYIEGE